MDFFIFFYFFFLWCDCILIRIILPGSPLQNNEFLIQAEKDCWDVLDILYFIHSEVSSSRQQKEKV